MSQQNVDFVRSKLETEAAKLAGASIKGQQLRKIRFREALQVILDNNLMFTRSRVEAAIQRANERLKSDGMNMEAAGEVFKRTLLSELENR